jgi:hypothetical protein
MKQPVIGCIAVLVGCGSMVLAQAPPATQTPYPFGPVSAAPPGARPARFTEPSPQPEQASKAVETSLEVLPYPGTPLWYPPGMPLLPPHESLEPAERSGKKPKSGRFGKEKKHKEAVDIGTAPQVEMFPGPGPQPYFWVSGEPLLWWVRSGSVPPLLTTGTGSGAGILGAPDTTVLVGGDALDYDLIVGGRVSAGYMNMDGTLGIEGNGFLMTHRTAHIGLGSSEIGEPILTRPITTTPTLTATTARVAFPGAFAGAVDISSTNAFWGAEGNFVSNRHSSANLGIDLLAGFRYLNLEENLRIVQTTQLLPGSTSGFAGSTLVAPAAVELTDTYRARNQFYGGQLGTQVEFRWRRLYTHVVGKVALGLMHEVVDVNGSSTAIQGGSSATVPGGILAVGSAIGRATRDDFAVVPEFNVNFGLQLTSAIRIYAGYTFLYLSDVVRPGDQVNTTIDPSQVPTSFLFGATGTAPSAPAMKRADFWAQGVNIGLALRY